MMNKKGKRVEFSGFRPKKEKKTKLSFFAAADVFLTLCITYFLKHDNKINSNIYRQEGIPSCVTHAPNASCPNQKNVYLRISSRILQKGPLRVWRNM